MKRFLLPASVRAIQAALILKEKEWGYVLNAPIFLGKVEQRESRCYGSLDHQRQTVVKVQLWRATVYCGCKYGCTRKYEGIFTLTNIMSRRMCSYLQTFWTPHVQIKEIKHES